MVVGSSIPLVDAIGKVTGKALYGTDLKMPGMLYGKLIRNSTSWRNASEWIQLKNALEDGDPSLTGQVWPSVDIKE
jgi:hypothetical protein